MLSDYANGTALLVFNQFFVYVMPGPLTVVNLLVIWLTWKKVRATLSRTFAFNLTIPSFGYNLYLIMLDILGALKLDQHFGFRAGPDPIFLDFLTDFTLYHISYTYRNLALLQVSLTYISFTRPMLYQRINHTKKMVILFTSCHLLAFLLALCATTAPNRAAYKYLSKDPYEESAVPVEVLEVISGCDDGITFAVLIVLYLSSIRAIFKFKRRNAKLQGTSSERLSRLHAQLYATLVLITPPTIFLIPNSICINFLIALVPTPAPVFDQLCQFKIELYTALLSMRLCLASTMILIAYGDYRRALVNAIKKVKPTFGGSTNVTVVQLTPRRP
ncbi:hypothetical protein QR680_019270 [Steinernema hermaphroditum]|uniref:G-protein coupled receptors family 1 profile domain-containing protein n=1 Tax=Steinernema hermaphroditum TaxID=289476 RepID=A0AA39HLI2_9BILA|nr:hypothetical protein QR680_019270 [Steinernema hermaphroditum]